ncbi:MAG: hypothetical protein ACLSDQ_02295 [Adlercreutzia equolifaciens]
MWPTRASERRRQPGAEDPRSRERNRVERHALLNMVNNILVISKHAAKRTSLARTRGFRRSGPVRAQIARPIAEAKTCGSPARWRRMCPSMAVGRSCGAFWRTW